MRVLIDTHTFIWFVSERKKLGPSALRALESPGCSIQISIASIWEISIKTSRGKLSIEGGFQSVETDLLRNSIEILGISFEHTLVNNRLPFHHKDPFDRIIAAQAIVEGTDFIGVDSNFDPYFSGTGVNRIW
jgi:PIN domain nuclease of toxin-antitoxin system